MFSSEAVRARELLRVMPAKAGIQESRRESFGCDGASWVPAFAGTTGKASSVEPEDKPRDEECRAGATSPTVPDDGRKPTHATPDESETAG
jgi:hypothetical protein